MRLIDADALQKEYMYEHDGKRLMLIDVAPTIETQQTCEYWDSESKFCALCRPSAQPEQRYTEEELRAFAHGISLSLLSKRLAQHWRHDKDTATEIEFLERLYDKVSADMKGGQG